MAEENVIPKHWKEVLSSEISDIRDGTHDTPKYVTSNGIPLITSKNLKENTIDFQKISYISKEDHAEISKRSKVEDGDILFAMIGTIGNPAIIKGDANFSIKNVGLFKKNEKVILPGFLVNYLRSCVFERQMTDRKLLKGTTQKFIPLGNLRKIIIPLPPLTEQQSIVSKIEELFSELDNGIENLRTAQQQLKTYRQSVLKWAFEGKLTEEWRARNLPGSRVGIPTGIHKNKVVGSSPIGHPIKMVRGSSPLLRTKTSKLEKVGIEPEDELVPRKGFEPPQVTVPGKRFELAQLPDGWKWVKAQDICETIQIGPFGTQLHKEDYIENGIPLINPTHIVDGFINADSSFTILKAKRDSLPNYILAEGDVIMGRRGEMARCGLVTKKENGWFCGTGSLYFRPKRNLLAPVFLYHQLRSEPTKKYLEDNAGGTTMANLNLKITNAIPIPLPPIEEQNAIIEIIENRLSVADKLEETISQSLQQAEALRQSILKRAFEGKLV